MDAIEKYRARRAKRMSARADEFEENDHPRDENGRFTSGSSSAPNGSKPPKTKSSPKEKINGKKVEFSKGDHAVCSDEDDPGIFYVYKKRDFRGTPRWSIHGTWERSANDGYRAVNDPRGNVTAKSFEEIIKKEFGD